MTLSHAHEIVQTPLLSIEALDERVQELMTREADALAQLTQWTQRNRKISGGDFARTLVFSWLAKPDASYSDLQAILRLQGIEASAQALAKRMTWSAVDFLRALLAAASSVLVSQEVETTKVFSRFEGVYLQDGTILSLPDELREHFKGCGGKSEKGAAAALRIQVRLNLRNGVLQGPWLQEAVECEREGEGSFTQTPLPTGALWVVDSLYPTQPIMKRMSQEGTFFLTHARADLCFVDQHGVKQNLKSWLQARSPQADERAVLDERISIGSSPTTRQHVRLIAFPVSGELAQARRDRQGQASATRGKGIQRQRLVGKKRGRPSKDGRHRCKMSQKRLELCDYTILLSNVPVELLSAKVARALMRSRWQIELLWKLWKQHGHIDTWCSEKPERILCEIYAKLIGLLLQHWLTLLGCWRHPSRSLVKASQAISMIALSYLLSWQGPLSSEALLLRVCEVLARCRLNTRKTRLTNAQRLALFNHLEGLS